MCNQGPIKGSQPNNQHCCKPATVRSAASRSPSYLRQRKDFSPGLISPLLARTDIDNGLRRVLCLVALPLRGLIMPTNLRVITERERKATQPETQTAITILLVFVIISLVMLVLLFLDQSFSKASIELMGRLAS